MSSTLPEVPSQLTGGCMCGAVRYEISEQPMFGALCHCNRCRPQSGSAFSTVVFIKRSTLRLEGETTVFEDVGASGKRVGRRCCARCGSPLTTEPDAVPDLMMVNDGEGGRHRQQRVVSTCDGAVCYPTEAMGGAGAGCPAI
jgi:hypothetical protein